MSKAKKIGLLLTALFVLFTLIFIAFKSTSLSGSWVKVLQRQQAQAVYGLGTVTSKKTFQAKASLSSKVKKIFVHEGETIKKGERLIELFDLPLITAPFDGTITSVQVNEGETSPISLPMLEMVSLSELEITLILEQAAALLIQPGQSTRIQFESIQGAPLDGKVRSIFPKLGQFYIKIDPQTFPPSVLPGMTADVAIEVNGPRTIFILPLKTAPQDSKVKIKKKNRPPQWIRVKLGSKNEEGYELLTSELPLETDDEVWDQR